MSYAASAVRKIVERGGEADDVLRSVVDALVERPDVSWAGIAFVEGDALRLGPATGEKDETSRRRATVSFQGADVGELWVDGTLAQGEVEQVAALLAPLVLIGWDTGGETWEP